MTNEENISRIVALNIELLAESNGEKISDIEQKLNVSPGYISRAKTGKKKLSIELCCKAEKYFNISLYSLISEEFYKDLKRASIEIEINKLQKRIKRLKELPEFKRGGEC